MDDSVLTLTRMAQDLGAQVQVLREIELMGQKRTDLVIKRRQKAALPLTKEKKEEVEWVDVDLIGLAELGRKVRKIRGSDTSRERKLKQPKPIPITKTFRSISNGSSSPVDRNTSRQENEVDSVYYSEEEVDDGKGAEEEVEGASFDDSVEGEEMIRSTATLKPIDEQGEKRYVVEVLVKRPTVDGQENFLDFEGFGIS